MRWQYMEAVRSGIATALWPLQKTVLAPLTWSAAFYEELEHWMQLKNMHRAYENLHAEKMQAGLMQIRQDYLDLENQRLRTLLQMHQNGGQKSTAAEILYAVRDPFFRRIVINKGSQQGIEAGEAVLDQHGLIGQVTRVFPLSSEVTLVTDKDQTVPVQIVRNGLRAVSFGTANGHLELRFLSANADIQVGDVLVTSGLDDIYWAGIPLAHISKIERQTSSSFVQVICTPIGGVEKNSQVLVLRKARGESNQLQTSEAITP